jgi:predicted PurR-regulated permease PerM
MGRDEFWREVAVRASAILISLGLLAAIWLFARPLALIIVITAITASIGPVAERLARRMPYALSVVVIYLLLFLIFAGTIWYLIPQMLVQIQQFSDRLPQLEDQTQQFFDQWGIQLDAALLGNISSQLGGLGSFLLSVPVRITSALFEGFLVFFASLYMLLEARAIRRFARKLFPNDTREHSIAILGHMVNAMGGYVRGTVIDSFIIGVVTYIGMLIIGVNYSAVLGILAGFMEFLPVLGPVIAGAAAVGIALLQSPEKALIVLIFAIGLQQLENQILVPNVMRGQTNMPSLLVILALLLGGTIGGVLGAIAAIPLASALLVLVEEVLLPAVQHKDGTPDAKPEGD